MLVVLVLLFLLFSPPTLSLTCTKDPSSTCKCTLDDGRVFDLSAAASTDPSKPRYSKSVNTGGAQEIFQFNPCHGFTCGTSADSNKAAVCDSIPSPSYNYYQVTGTQDSVQYAFSGDKLQMKFSSQNTYTSTITFTCTDKAGYGTFDMQANNLDLVGTLSSSYACFKSESGGSSSSLSLGDILLIIFFSALAVYIITGILFQAFVRKQRGLGLVPNSSFWFGLPGNVKSGGQFVVGKVKASKSDYNNI